MIKTNENVNVNNSQKEQNWKQAAYVQLIIFKLWWMNGIVYKWLLIAIYISRYNGLILWSFSARPDA